MGRYRRYLREIALHQSQVMKRIADEIENVQTEQDLDRLFADFDEYQVRIAMYRKNWASDMRHGRPERD